jgi:hypothetical protein
MQKFGNDQACGTPPRPTASSPSSSLTRADRLVLRRLAQMEVRRRKNRSARPSPMRADEDPLAGAG